MSDFDLIVDSKDVVLAGNNLLKMGKDADLMSKSAQSSASVFVAAFSKIEKQIDLVSKTNKQFSSTSQQMYNNVLKVGTASKSAADSARIFERDLNKQETTTRRANAAAKLQANELERLKNKYQPLYAVSKQYEMLLEELEIAYQTGIISSKQYGASLDRLNGDFQQLQNGTAGWSNQLVQGSQKGARSMNSMNVVTQQLGYQVGDFAVQVQSGQSALVAFSQQATQLVGILPLMADKLGLSMGAAVGLSAGLGIGIPVITGLAGVLWTVMGASDDASSEIETFEDKLKSAREEVSGMKDDLELLKSGFDNMFEKTLFDSLKEAEVDLIAAQTALEDLQNSQSKGNRAYDAQVSSAAVNVRLAQELVSLREDELKVSQDLLAETKALNEAKAESIRAEEDLVALLEKGRQATLDRMRANMDAIRESKQELETLKLIQQYGEDSIEIAKQRAEQEAISLNLTEESAATYIQLAVEAHVVSQEIERSKDSAEGLSDALKDAASAMSSLLSVGSLEAKLSGLVAETNAIRSGADSASASLVATELTKAGQMRDEALSAGVLPTSFINQSYRDRVGLIESVGSATADRNLARDDAKSDGSSGDKDKDKDDFIESLNKEMAQRRTLNGLFGDQRTLQEEIFRIEKGLGESRSQYSKEAIQAIAQENVLLQELEVAYEAKLEAQQEIADFMKNNMVDAFDTIFDKTKSAEEKFKSFAKSVVDQLMKIVVTQQLVGSFDVGSGSGNGIMGVLGGALFGGFREAGGSVSSDRSYVVGERGPELFSPPSNGTIMSNANMNNLASSKQQVELIIHAPEGMNIETVRSEVGVQIRQAAPKIIRTSVGATQKAMKHGPKGAFGL
jgi:hypothetical protein